ncbi:hypothetical protein OSL44_24780, partial [Escherichia coli]|nr:hypothetical protein [Escherichia coli]
VPFVTGDAELDAKFVKEATAAGFVNYPESDMFVSSGIYERYAFDSYFNVTMEDMEGGQILLTAQKNYDYTWELFSLVCRIL